jgi:hypothetical protein
MLVLPSVRTPHWPSPLRPRVQRTRGAVRPRPWTRLRARLSPCPRGASRTPAPASPFFNDEPASRVATRAKALEVWDRSRQGERLARLGGHELVDRRSRSGGSPWPTTPGKDGDLLEDAPLTSCRGTRARGQSRRPAPRPPAVRARRGDRRQSSRTHALIPAGSIDSPSRAGFAFPVGQSSSRFRRALSRCAATCSAETLRLLFRATEPGTIPVPHRRRSSGVASGRGFLPTVLRYPEPRLSVGRRRRSCSGPPRAVAPRTQLQRLVRRDRLDPAARLRAGSQTRTR